MKSYPLENYSSLHEFFFYEIPGWPFKWPHKKIFVQFNFNLHTPQQIHPKAYLSLHTHDADSPISDDCCYSIKNIKRWRLDISSYQSINDYLNTSARWHRCNYMKSQKNFLNYGCEIRFIEKDWSEYAEDVYQLYINVAHRYRYWLYDLHFFQEIAKRPDYTLLCAMFEGKMIGVCVLQEELPTIHSVCCGLDYQNSTPSYSYSWMCYALIEHAIAAQKYKNVDVGLSANEAKRKVGFTPILSRMDIYAHGLTGKLLKGMSHIIDTTIDSEGKLKPLWHRSL